MQNKTLAISVMDEKEINDIAIQLAKVEGWNPGLNDAKSFYAQDSQGFIKSCLNDQLIGCCATTIYDEKFAFFGLYIVKPEFRKRGYGMQMTSNRLLYAGDRNIGLDAVVEMSSQYERTGFRPAHINIRYQGQGSLEQQLDSHVVQISDDLRPLVETYDSMYFPANRKAFLDSWLKPAKDHIPLVYMNEGMVKGYGVMRRCYKGYKVGPLFAESFEIAEKIFRALISQTHGELFFLDVPEINTSALKLAECYQMQPYFKTWRMYTKEAPDINLDNVYGLTTLELG